MQTRCFAERNLASEQILRMPPGASGATRYGDRIRMLMGEASLQCRTRFYFAPFPASAYGGSA